MIILDTNIISELMKSSPMPNVITWADAQNPIQLFITTITIAEIAYGLSALPDGARKSYLEESFHKVLQEGFKHRILSFNETAAYTYGKIMGSRKRLGRPLSVADGQIAALAVVHNFSLATRNSTDFEDCGITLINPFDAAKS